MNKLKFLVLEDQDTIIAEYPCGLRDKSLTASYHGGNWALWKLLDQVEKHAKKCQVC